MQPYNVSLKNPTHVVIELFGGDNNLSSYVEEDLQEIVAGNSGTFAVLALADLEDRPASIWEVTQENGIRHIEDVGEIDTGDPEVLADFVARALLTYADCDHIAIGFWDHGSGTFDEFDADQTVLERRLNRVPRRFRTRSQPARHLFFPRGKVAANPNIRAMLHDDTNGGVLTNLEAGGMLKAAFSRAGRRQKVDMIFSDTCLNGMIEVTEQLSPYAECIVGSEDLEPGDGWDYQLWFSKMSASPPRSAADWAYQAVEAFGESYAGQTWQHPCTLGAFHTDHSMTDKFRELVDILRKLPAEAFWETDRARATSQSFDVVDSYDLKDFVRNLQKVASNNEVVSAAKAIEEAFDKALVHSVALGQTVPDANGLAFWFPANKRNLYKDLATYRELDFNKKTGWAEYLHRHR